MEAERVDTRMYSIKEVREYLGIGTQRVLRLIREGKLEAIDLIPKDERWPGTPAGSFDLRGVRITPDSLQSYVDSIRI
jgi:hypothetical protein